MEWTERGWSKSNKVSLFPVEARSDAELLGSSKCLRMKSGETISSSSVHGNIGNVHENSVSGFNSRGQDDIVSLSITLKVEYGLVFEWRIFCSDDELSTSDKNVFS